jgi:putative mRNA 3-end processing factor
VLGSAWARRLGEHADAFASGWMQLRGARRRQGVDRGFVLSDHADWPGLQAAIAATGAARVIVTHGYEAVMVRGLRERGLEAGSFQTAFGDEALEEPAEAASPGPDGSASTSTSASTSASTSTSTTAP